MSSVDAIVSASSPLSLHERRQRNKIERSDKWAEETCGIDVQEDTEVGRLLGDQPADGRDDVRVPHVEV